MYNKRESESYLEELSDALGEVLVALDVELQFIESGWKCRGASALVTAAQQTNKTQVGYGKHLEHHNDTSLKCVPGLTSTRFPLMLLLPTGVVERECLRPYTVT